MKRKSQSELIMEMNDREITLQLVLTQLSILILAIIGSVFLFDAFWADWSSQVGFHLNELLLYGLIPGLMVLLIDLFLVYRLPQRMYDDGGINVKVFKNRSSLSIIGITLLVAVSEEMLFRGVLHAEFGYVVASVLFAVMHIRYLTKIVLLISVLFVSFFIGYMYEMTGNLLVTILAHFLIDVVLAFWIRFGKWGEADE
ncbi:CPBP family intramembrane metalloprotease [Halobacillus litoralis]|uniref:CPBP family intramembrane metalloprotease n=1 Tax=Halobacillus litoralis TaxID=45668 RepID=A0A845FBP2_9BACI|nr:MULTISPECIES: CPBP family intramembrane glutamic endopeptidase [Halobacillus]MEC3884699.1 CPBP family intramembrane glutamic endopeptidase [Halobacillus sp. HZG1]MYL71238.1 CPBP family intramembrane metalloprotease [Halobacillus litoralis]